MDKENQTKTANILKWTIVGVLGFAIIILAFGAGIWVGQERARFSFRWAEDYHRNFAGPRGGVFGNFPGEDFMGGHGIFGSIIKIEGNTLIVKDQKNIENTINVLDDTAIVDRAKNLKISDLKADDNIVVIGSPNAQGQIDAKLIRILPPPPARQAPALNYYDK